MVSYGKSFLMVAVATIAAAATSASAVTVTYTAMGRFGTSGAFSSTATQNFTDGSGNASILTFSAGAPTFNANVTTSSFATFGNFSVATGGPGDGPLAGKTFQLLVTQTAPSPGGSQLTSSLFSGTFFNVPTSSTSVQLVFAPNLFTIFGGVGGSNVVYSINTPTNVDGAISGTITITPGSDNPAVPLPSAAFAGSALLAGVAGVRRMRRAIVV